MRTDLLTRGERLEACARNADGSVTTFLCPVHADDDPCRTTAAVTGRRRRGSVVRGTCTNCGWSATVSERDGVEKMTR